MSIVVQYGNYTHAAGEVEYAINKTAKVSDRGIPVAEVVSIDMQGLLMADSTAEIDSAVTSLRNAYKQHNQDWRVLSNGSPLGISILAADTVGGISVVAPPSFPDNRSAAYVLTLPYRIQLQYEIAILDQEYALKSFTETLTFTGGGSRYGHIEVATGLPVKQKLRANTTFRAIQQGSAVGFYKTPDVPDPIWPEALTDENPERTLGAGMTRGPIGEPRQTDIPVSWKYVFESAYSLSGRPNVWGTAS